MNPSFSGAFLSPKKLGALQIPCLCYNLKDNDQFERIKKAVFAVVSAQREEYRGAEWNSTL